MNIIIKDRGLQRYEFEIFIILSSTVVFLYKLRN